MVLGWGDLRPTLHVPGALQQCVISHCQDLPSPRPQPHSRTATEADRPGLLLYRTEQPLTLSHLTALQYTALL